MASEDGSGSREKESESSPLHEAPAPTTTGDGEVAPGRDADGPAAVAQEGGAAEAVRAEREAAAAPPASRHAAAAPPKGAAWGEPIARFERRWTWLETRLITLVLLAEIVSLVAWVLLSGLAAPPSADSSAGTVFRGVVGTAALGALGWAGTRRLGLQARRAVTFAGIAAGIAVAPLWRGGGVDYFENIRGWLQEGSTLTMMGGLRGLATRLTLWLALLGGSLATSAGKHIHVDLLLRALPVRLRVPASIASSLATALVCLAGVWGFLDHIAIESFGARADEAPAAKVARVAHQIGDHAFLTGKQIGLDLRTLPRVLVGGRYDGWMTAPEWNAWVKGGFEGRYPAEGVANLLVPDDSPPHVPLVISPEGEPSRGLLVHDLSLVFPFGLLVIGLRFLLRVLLLLSGHISVDPDEAHKEELRRASEGVPAEIAGGA